MYLLLIQNETIFLTQNVTSKMLQPGNNWETWTLAMLIKCKLSGGYTNSLFYQILNLTKSLVKPWQSSLNNNNNAIVLNITYYINTNGIPNELSHENLISSHVKITCYLHM